MASSTHTPNGIVQPSQIRWKGADERHDFQHYGHGCQNLPAVSPYAERRPPTPTPAAHGILPPFSDGTSDTRRLSDVSSWKDFTPPAPVSPLPHDIIDQADKAEQPWNTPYEDDPRLAYSQSIVHDYRHGKKDPSPPRIKDDRTAQVERAQRKKYAEERRAGQNGLLGRAVSGVQQYIPSPRGRACICAATRLFKKKPRPTPAPSREPLLYPHDSRHTRHQHVDPGALLEPKYSTYFRGPHLYEGQE